jgi:hypothetical protein
MYGVLVATLLPWLDGCSTRSCASRNRRAAGRLCMRMDEHLLLLGVLRYLLKQSKQQQSLLALKLWF